MALGENNESRFSIYALQNSENRKNNTFSLGTDIDYGQDLTTGAIKGAKPFIIYLGDLQDEANLILISLLINPTDLAIDLAHILDSKYTRDGYIVQFGGPDQPSISANGKSAAFYTPYSGLTSSYRKSSAGYLNISALLGIFKNNGWNFLTSQDSTGRKTRVISVIDTVKVFWDGTTYEGFFKSLSITEDAENPYNFSYSFSFNISGLLGDTMEGHIGRKGFSNREDTILYGYQHDGDFTIDVQQDQKVLSENLLVTNTTIYEMVESQSLGNSQMSQGSPDLPEGRAKSGSTLQKVKDNFDRPILEGGARISELIDSVNKSLGTDVPYAAIKTIWAIESSGSLDRNAKENANIKEGVVDSYDSGPMQVNTKNLYNLSRNKEYLKIIKSYGYTSESVSRENMKKDLRLNFLTGTYLYAADGYRAQKGDLAQASRVYNGGPKAAGNRDNLAVNQYEANFRKNYDLNVKLEKSNNVIKGG
jgi:hypothetical protein